MKKKSVMLVLFLAGLLFASNYPVFTIDTAPIRKEFTVLEGQPLTFDIASYDPDGDSMDISLLSAIPSGAVLGATTYKEIFTDPSLPVPTSDSTPKWYIRNFSWTPNFKQAGEYILDIKAVDSLGAENYVKYKITVVNVNRPPVL